LEECVDPSLLRSGLAGATNSLRPKIMA
jgi:hypothetical protein